MHTFDANNFLLMFNRTICLHSAEDEGFDLLTSLVHHGIVKPDKEVWKLFLPDVTQPLR